MPEAADDNEPKTLQYCEGLANKLDDVKKLPKGCLKYGNVVQKIEKKAAEGGQLANRFTGMSTGQVQRLKQAQFQRRATRAHKMSGSGSHS